jgi:glycosyltransferase involved in cell wall biosynthesis
VHLIAHNGARIWGGAERATCLLLAGLQRRGHRIELYCNDARVMERARALGLPTRRVRLGGDIALPDALRCARLLRRERPDVLLIGTFRKLGLAALAGRLARVPRIVARIGLETDTPRSWKYRFVLARWVDAVVLSTDRIRQHYLALPGWTEERVATINHGVRPPVRTREPGAVRRSLGLEPQQRVIGTVARLAEQKRLDRLLHALAGLPDDVHCIIAGDGELRGSLERLARELKLDARVHFLGLRDDVGDVLAALDVFVVASDREGMSNAMLEALAAGVPVVSTPVSGAAEALEPFPDGDTPGEIAAFSGDALAAATARVLGDPQRRAAMANAALQRAHTRFDFERMLDAWERVLSTRPLRRPAAGAAAPIGLHGNAGR